MGLCDFKRDKIGLKAAGVIFIGYVYQSVAYRFISNSADGSYMHGNLNSLNMFAHESCTSLSNTSSRSSACSRQFAEHQIERRSKKVGKKNPLF